MWSGLFFSLFSGVFLSLFLLCLLSLCFVFLTEPQKALKSLSVLLVLFCILFFFSPNFFLLYFFFELSIFPILFMVLGFGAQVENVGASFYLLFYSCFCSLPFLLVLFIVGSEPTLLGVLFSWELTFVSSLLFLINFPLYFLHLWLPKAHVEAPTTASILLAGILLKLGTGGFLRVVSLFVLNFEYWLFVVSFLGVFSASFLCVLQSDLNALAAYSSVNHIMFLLFCLVTLSGFGVWSGVSIMLAHGFVSTLMFFFIGEFFHNSLSRMVYFFGGFLVSSSFFFFFFGLVWLFNTGVPPSVSFFSEYLGVSTLFNMGGFVFLLLFFYFFVSFYYSLFILVCCFVGNNSSSCLASTSFSSFFLLLWAANLFFFSLFF